MSPFPRCLACLPLLALALTGLATRAVADENDLLEYCLDNPKACAISVEAIDEGWQGHLNADRPQVLASTYKTVVLLTYAQAVADGVVSPDDTVDKNEWARYFSGGTSLSTSWDRMGQPDQVRLDDLARLMIVISDNSTPDLLQALIKKKRFKKTVKLFDWHDFPAPISAMFGLWQNLNGVGGTGNRIASDYGGFEAAGYQKELTKHTKALKGDAFVETVRAGLCDQPPWLPGTPPCNPQQPFTTEESFQALENGYFNRSTTRSYATLMRKLVNRTLLSPAAQEVAERHLEAWLEEFPTLQSTFSRYGLKGGSLASAAGPQILTWAHYLETGAGRFVAVVFLQELASTRRPPDAADVNAFAQQFALSASFRQRVRDAIGDAALPPELVPQLKKVKSQGLTVTVKAEVWNTSPNASGGPFKASLFLLDDTATAGATPLKTVEISSIAGYKSKKVTLKATAEQDISGKLAVVLIDSEDAVGEQDENNNLTWERLN